MVLPGADIEQLLALLLLLPIRTSVVLRLLLAVLGLCLLFVLVLLFYPPAKVIVRSAIFLELIIQLLNCGRLLLG